VEQSPTLLGWFADLVHECRHNGHLEGAAHQAHRGLTLTGFAQAIEDTSLSLWLAAILNLRQALGIVESTGPRERKQVIDVRSGRARSRHCSPKGG
jgi:hypothetical protein